jgi:hypothetical protein
MIGSNAGAGFWDFPAPAMVSKGDDMPPWTQENIDKVASLTKQGWSRSRIGHELGVTRNAVCGIVCRNKMKSPHSRKIEAPAIPKPERGGKNAAQILDRIEQKKKAIERPKLEPVAIAAAVKNESAPRPGIPLMMLEKGQCRFPVNDAYGDELHLFCAAPVDPRVSVMGACYCAAHHALAVTPTRPASVAAKTIGSWAA